MFKKGLFKIFIITSVCLLAFMSVSYNNQERKILQTDKRTNNNKLLQADNIEVNNYDEFYNAIKRAISNCDSSVTLKISGYDEKVFNLSVFTKVLQDNPQLRYICTGASTTVRFSIPIKLTIDFKYIDTNESLQAKEKAVKQKVQEIVNKVVKPGMKDYEKEAALHDYLVNNSQYDKRVFTEKMPKDSNTAYGILINGIGACQGYSDAMYRLLYAVGIESRIIVGDADNGDGWVSHAWNIVKIGGQYYHLDVTWDDPVTEDGSNQLEHSYFNITDEQILKNHKWNKIDYHQCNNTTYTFNNLNLSEVDIKGKPIIVVKDYDEFYKSIKKALIQGSSDVSVKILNYNANVYNISSTVEKAYDSLSKGGSYNWIEYSDEISNSKYITITFD